MTRTALLPSPVFKEVRALAVPWLACIVAMIVPVIVNSPRFLGGVSVPAYVLGAAALGALSIGHEYTVRTLDLLLTLPARRERLLLVKLGVLAAMLLTLWVVADTLAIRDPRAPQTLLLVPVLWALCLAPWLTMACRNPIAGTVFTLAIPGMLWAVGEWLGVAKYGRGRDMEAFRMAILWRGTLALCAIGAVMSWRMFMRLEAIDGPDQDVRLPQWLRWPASANPVAPRLTKRHPVWLLAKKELHLQQMTLVVAGFYLVGFAVASLSRFESDVDGTFTLLTIFYVGLIPLLIGSFASAGERQLGTLEWQILLPLGTSKQWAVKMGVVLGLAILLALGLPALCASLNPVLDPRLFLRPGIAVEIVLVTAGSLYVSSACNSGLIALLMSLPATLGAVMFAGFAIAWSATTSWRLPGVMRPPGSVQFRPTGLIGGMSLLLVVGFIAVVQRIAFANHRSAERGAGRVWKQVILMAAYVTAAIMIVAGVEAFQHAFLRTW